MNANEPQSEPSGQALPAGTRLEEFVIERVLGSGGFGITYLARDTSLGRQVVIKENLPVQFCFRDPASLTVAPRHTQGDDAENFRWSLENFSKEAAMLASLDHPGIVKVLRSFGALGTAYFVMPFVAGVTLDELILSRREKGLEFSGEELRGLLERTLDALAHLHDRGIYHRDIKPGNILIATEGVPTLIDFGSARQRLSERSMTVVESAGYTPFEQLQSRGNVGPWSDLYALGGTLCKVMTGEAPPKANDRVFDDPYQPLAGRADLRRVHSERFLGGIDRALALQQRDRWQDGKQWLEAVNAAIVPAPRISQMAHVVSPVQVAPPAPVALASPVRRPGEEQDFEIAEGVLMRMCWIPPGAFVMGSPKDEPGRSKDETPHQVTLTEGFWLGKFAVTQAQWRAVMGGNPSYFKGANWPVESVSWNHIVRVKGFLRSAGFLEKANQHGSTTEWFHLPTEAQWEYACRAGTTTALNNGKDLTSTTGACPNFYEVAWYQQNSGGKPHPVGQKKANAWGLHDMHGNVWEWCADGYAPYPNGPTKDPQGPRWGSDRMLRGGSWHTAAGYCRAAYRRSCYPAGNGESVGFRLARSSAPYGAVGHFTTAGLAGVA